MRSGFHDVRAIGPREVKVDDHRAKLRTRLPPSCLPFVEKRVACDCRRRFSLTRRSLRADDSPYHLGRLAPDIDSEAPATHKVPTRRKSPRSQFAFFLNSCSRRLRYRPGQPKIRSTIQPFGRTLNRLTSFGLITACNNCPKAPLPRGGARPRDVLSAFGFASAAMNAERGAFRRRMAH